MFEATNPWAPSQRSTGLSWRSKCLLVPKLPIGPEVVPFWDYLVEFPLNPKPKPKKELLWGLWVQGSRALGPRAASRFMLTQTFQNPFIKEYTLYHNRIPNMN